ncbi:probable G-protein coupled receptor CG31760 [Cimex lectularius]|uniref:G-protein coupled receptors family 3 profile domain-containing protein n=1 Tax=Cimex lectularius TaxID=79782 RepID=A0A8I6S509_CIMLE|nr:probable G-protein coupled receptor CG31760 [Cimex lectularius]XP_014256187.1 probable G-protein coupled receptor CG31760 [Cimex lectularius]
MGRCLGCLLVLFAVLRIAQTQSSLNITKDNIEDALKIIEEVATNNLGNLCVTEGYRILPAPVLTERYEGARQKAELAAALFAEIGLVQRQHGQQHPQLHSLVDGVAHSLLVSEKSLLASRVVTLNASTDLVTSSAVWRRESGGMEWRQPAEVVVGVELPMELPWIQPSNSEAESNGYWTTPHYSCKPRSWIISYTVPFPTNKHGSKGYLSIDVDISHLDVNQCDSSEDDDSNQIVAFKGSHKCHSSTKCIYHNEEHKWSKGNYVCHCRKGYYMTNEVPFLGNLVEAAWLERKANQSTTYDEIFKCKRCSEGCATCRGPAPCLAQYKWPFRIALMSISATCVLFTLCLIVYVYHHRRLKIFKVASPIFLCITLIGCVIMYLEMAAIFPVLDMYSCIATKWSRHLGFCITYTALLMKTWRVSLTYRVKSAHKVKLTDKQLLQWMFPILLVMLIYLGTWTLSAAPIGEDIKDNTGLSFKQCTYNWWDHSIAIGEVLFLGWGIRVCYSVRNAESLFNEARLISYAIYNIAIVNCAMVAFHLFLFPRAGPDIKYLLGFIRTQLSTTVTIALVFGPKVVRVLKGQGDQWDKRARARAVTASFSLNGIGLVTEETTDLYQENEELKEEIQKLAGQIEFMRIVSMEMNNRHVKPKPGGYFSVGTTVLLQSPRTPREPQSKVDSASQQDHV